MKCDSEHCHRIAAGRSEVVVVDVNFDNRCPSYVVCVDVWKPNFIDDWKKF